MRLFVDESLSPLLATRLNEAGDHDATHPLHIGRRGEPDHRVLARSIEEDRIIVTQNARDFRKLMGKIDLHPGLIILPSVDREGSWAMLQTALRFLVSLGEPADAMVNHVLEVSIDGKMALSALP